MKKLCDERIIMREEIVKKLLQTAKNKIGKDIVDIDSELLGNDINFKPVELAIFLKELEKEFNISFKNEDITQGLFNNVTNIAALVEKETVLKNNNT